jgi:predicted helicase
MFPLYLYDDGDLLGLSGSEATRTPNLSPRFLRLLSDAISGRFVVAQASSSDQATFDPEDVLAYIVAILHSPSYRLLYADELLRDFPRIPLPGSFGMFGDLVNLGAELVAMHLMESPKLDDFVTAYVGPKNPEVVRVGWSDGTVWLDASATKNGQSSAAGSIGFRGVPESVWRFSIGGYQVCEKWLKDRKGRILTGDDMSHYQRIIVALQETIHIMGQIDDVIDNHGGWQDAFSVATDLLTLDPA